MVSHLRAVVRRLHLFLVLLFFGAACSGAFAQSAGTPVEVTGEASVVVFDDFQTGRSEIRYYIVDEKSQRERRLFFAGEAPPAVQTGKKIRVRGRGRPEEGIDVDSVAEMDGAGSDADGDEAAAALAPPETRNILTLLVDFSDATVAGGNYGTDVPGVRNRMYNESKSVAGLFFNASLGTLGFNPNADGDGVQDVFHVAIDDSYLGGDSSQCTPSTWVSKASTAWQDANPDKDIGVYRHRLLIVPNYWDYGNRHCTWGGVAQVGCGTWCWAIGADPESIMHGVIVHELGHNLGFNHARSDENNNGFNPGESTDVEYGDNSDMMGSSRNWKKFNAPHAEDKGWIDPVDYEIREVLAEPAPQQFDLLALDDEAWDWPGLRALKLERSSNTDYYVTFRRASGDYNSLNSMYRDRINIYYGFDNSTYSYFVAALAAGESFTDASQDLVITATSPVTVNEGTASTVAMGVEVCLQPCVGIEAPSDLSAAAVATDAIDLTWTDNASDEDGFELQRSTDGSSWASLTTLTSNETQYTDSGLTPGTLYSYRVRATSAAGDSAWSNVASAQTFGLPPTADFTIPSQSYLEVNFADASTDSDGEIISWSWNFGDGNTSAAQNPEHTYAAADSYTVTLTVTDNDGDSDSVSATVTVEAPPPYADYAAIGERSVAGTVSGSYALTAVDDGSAQVITERESGGRKSTRHSYLEHQWQFNIPAGESATVLVNAWQSESADNDSFDFAWSSNGSDWSPMFNIAATADDTPLSFALPSGVSGDLWIRATDTDRQSGNRTLDSLSVDYLQIRVANGTPEPLAGDAPSGLTATAVSADSIELSWTDNTSNEAGFAIERSEDGLSFTEVATTAMNGGASAAYTDTGLADGTQYSYRVRAFKRDETTAFSNVASATTDPAPAISLEVTGYKVKGQHYADLNWSGVAGDTVEIYRDESVVASTSNDGAYTDAIGSKGGATYSYRVCEAGSSACSETLVVVF
ncbi:MAG: fibronectin type III domain-containing protein [Xanthomonadales bacterium]|nr:fibronectin type III domain-containing protein [Xanthomonadales bacterium]